MLASGTPGPEGAGTSPDAPRMRRIDQIRAPQLHARESRRGAAIRIKCIDAVVLRRDHNKIVLDASDQDVGDPQRLRINRSIDGAGKTAFRRWMCLRSPLLARIPVDSFHRARGCCGK
jgi:hypothetical protein